MELRDTVHLRYEWQINDIPSLHTCGDKLSAGHAMICRQGGFIVRRHEAEMLNVVCHVKVQPVLQEITGQDLARCSNAPDARLGIYARGFWAR